MNEFTVPRVAVLLSVYNGRKWIQTQITSILKQSKIAVTVFISVDPSTDGSGDLCVLLTRQHKNIIVLPNIGKFGSAGKNFYRLIEHVDLTGFDYIAFADQDDIWEPDKLIRHAQLAKRYSADGVSSNVLAFWPNGKERLVNKAQPQRELDYLFESAGPGCTFLMTPWLVSKVREQLLEENNPAKEVTLHDWLTYAVCRAHGHKWVIDATPSVQYRQHQFNVLGANAGFKAALARVSKFRNGWYFAEVCKVATVCWRISEDKDVKNIAELTQNKRLCSRVRLLQYVPRARRKFLDRVALVFLILIH